MENLYYKPGDLSPKILFEFESGQFLIQGISCPENAVEFYQPVLDWLDEYSENPSIQTVLDFRMDYFNSISAKLFLMIMTKLEELNESGNTVKIRWYFDPDEEDIEEAGEDFESILDIDFELLN